MKRIKDILYKVSIQAVEGSTNIAFTNIHFDSRKIKLNDIFIAIKGLASDGHNFIQNATHQGAIAIICEQIPAERINGVTYVQVADTREALAYISSNYYDNPSSKLKLIGVTGTNGKTTITSLLYKLFQKSGYASGLISTITIIIDNKEFPTNLTTPDSLTINKHLDKMVQAGVAYVFMEVSSHGIDQKRSLGLDFDGAIFTNLSHDHLDYHNSFKQYRDTKKKLFDQLKKNAFALTNIDDKNGEYMVQNTKAKRYTYALKSYADYKAKILENSFTGLHLNIEKKEIWTKVIGEFNAYNLLAAFAVSSILNLDEIDTLRYLSEIENVKGRFQHFKTPIENISIIVDYAHTPDALKNVLQTINSIRSKNKKVITVLGCGGDRDKTKRPIMGNIATQLSDFVIFTSDNPRNEDPETIIEEIKKGVDSAYVHKSISIIDRKEAIVKSSTIAQPEDIILIAGKGHETYQIIKDVKHNFDDMKIIQSCFAKNTKI